MSSGVTLVTLQDKQMLDDFVEAKRGGICGIRGDRYIISKNNNKSNNNINENSNNNSNNNNNSSILYIDANNLYSYAMMQSYPARTLSTLLLYLWILYSNSEDSDHGCYIVCDINYTNSCKYRTEQLVLMPNKIKINDNKLGYRERENREINLRSKQQNRIYGSVQDVKVLCQDGCKSNLNSFS